MVYQCFGLFYCLQNDRLNQHLEQMKVFQLARGASQVGVSFSLLSCMNKTNIYRWISICHTLHTFDCAACFFIHAGREELRRWCLKFIETLKIFYLPNIEYTDWISITLSIHFEFVSIHETRFNGHIFINDRWLAHVNGFLMATTYDKNQDDKIEFFLNNVCIRLD